MTIRVVLADDQAIVRQGLEVILNAQPGIEVVGTAADGQAAVAMALDLRPDVCLFDIRMPVIDGIEATRRLMEAPRDPKIAVVVITTFDHDEYVFAALRAGARGFLLKDAGPELLGQAIRAAANDDAIIAPSITARLLATFARSERRRPMELPGEALTDREEEVLHALARGRTNTEIGADLRVSLSTVKSHVSSILTKVGARNRVELAIWAFETDRVRR